MERVEFLLNTPKSNNSTKVFDIATQDHLLNINKDNSLILSKNNSCITKSIIQNYCRNRFIDTQCFPAIHLSKKDVRRIQWHLNYAFQSAIINWFNMEDVISHFSPSFPKMQLEYSDVMVTVRNHMNKIAPKADDVVEHCLKRFDLNLFNVCVEYAKENYQNFDRMKELMLIADRTKHYLDDEHKPKIRFHVYGAPNRERAYEKVVSWDGSRNLEIPSYLKNDLYKWYATEKRACVKWLKNKLEPYFVKGKGWTAYTVETRDKEDRVGLQNLFESLSKNVKRNSIKAVDVKELDRIRKDIESYLDKFVSTISDQTDARNYVENYKDEPIDYKPQQKECFALPKDLEDFFNDCIGLSNDKPKEPNKMGADEFMAYFLNDDSVNENDSTKYISDKDFFQNLKNFKVDSVEEPDPPMTSENDEQFWKDLKAGNV